MPNENLSQLLTTLQSLSNGAAAIIFEFVAKFDADGRPIAPKELGLERKESNSIPELPELVFVDAIEDDGSGVELPQESVKLILSAIAPSVASIYAALEFPRKVIETGGFSGGSYSLESGGYLVAVPTKSKNGCGICHEASWDTSHDFSWEAGFRGFIVNYFTWEEINSQSYSPGMECRLFVADQ